MAKVPMMAGGQPVRRDVMNYKPPMGPKNVDDPRGVGLHGPAPSHCGTQGPEPGPKGGSSGSPGIGGDNLGCCGTQGKH
jgi:hypothetical protein